ncbi:cobyric acid synthase [uncultured Methylovirgula sp.]|uniref:cobyric acid synthase n=1 Tax=uncultured Methylovirgula sp. TaxID=1285960 RepID=UPI002627EE26|nr:cobyric acid synthase [uncultured Methylovirgula sp.]
MVARRLMFQGTGSDVGKSLIVAGLARAYRRRGLSVMPFKPQNMSNNAAVTVDGGEIGRAQALQARAAGVVPSAHMNPVLLKPQSEIGAQVVAQGRVIGTAKAQEYQSWKPKLRAAVLESFAVVAAQADLVLVEGAGSPAEINLRANDIANMGFARAADCPVVLIGDIDRGGVIAQVAGTKLVLDPDDAALIRGIIINKFRGDAALFEAGMKAIEQHSGWPALGLVPYFADAALLPAEDTVPRQRFLPSGERRPLKIVTPVLPHIANFDDLDPLAAEPDVALVMIRHGTPLPADADLIILPGSKATRADMMALLAEGWDIDIKAHVRRGKSVLGLCGGFQLLGRRIADPYGIEGEPGETPGLGLLDVETILGGDKTLLAIEGHAIVSDAPFKGYEMHVGRTSGPDCARPMHRLVDGRNEGARSADGRVAGTYMHGLFNDDNQRRAWLEAFGAESRLAYEDQVERTLDKLAAHLERCLDLDRLLSLAK